MGSEFFGFLLALKKVIKNNKESFFLFGILLTSFFLSFYKGTSIHCTEDFKMGTASLRFLKEPSFSHLMMSNHQGLAFLTLPFHLLLGFGLFPIRLAQSIFICLSSVVFYLFLKNHLNQKKALVSTLILIFFPTFILVKYPAYPFLTFFMIGLLYFYSRLTEKRTKDRDWVITGIFLGLGTYFKLNVIYFGLSILAGHFLSRIRGIKLDRSLIKKGLILGVGFLIGSTPLLLGFFGRNFNPVLEVFSNMKTQGHNNLEFFTNFLRRVSHLEKVLSHSPQGYSGDLPYADYLYTLPLLFSIPYLLSLGKDREKFFVSSILAFIALHTFVPTIMIKKHLYPSIPLVSAILGSTIVGGLEKANLKRKKYFKYGVFGIFLLLGISNTLHILSTERHLGRYSTCYEIGDKLRKRGVESVYLFTPKKHCLWHSLNFKTRDAKIVNLHEAMGGRDRVYVNLPPVALDGHSEGKGLFEALNESLKEEAVYIASQSSLNLEYKNLSKEYEPIQEFLRKKGFEMEKVKSRTREKMYFIWGLKNGSTT